MRAIVTMTSISPMLMHSDDVEWADEMTAWRKRPENAKRSVAGDDRSPAWRWIGSLWNDGQHVTIPAPAIMACIREGAKKVPTGKRQQTWKAGSQSSLIPEAPHFTLANAQGELVDYKAIRDELMGEDDFVKHREAAKRHGFELDVRRSKPQMSKHVRVRPMFTAWSCRVALLVADADIAPALDDIMHMAGSQAGLGNWRPSAPTSPGPWGRFSTTVEIEQ